MNKRAKLRAMKSLGKSKQYVLVTDEETTVNADFKGFTGIMMAHALKDVIKKLEGVLKNIGAKKEKPNGRKQGGRPKSSPKK